MSDTSARQGWPIPSRGYEPFYDAFVALVNAIDASVYGAAREDRNLLFASSATVTWTESTGSLTWDAAIEILNAPTGYLCTLAPAGVTLAEGQILYAQLVRAPASTVVLAATVGAQAPGVGADDTIVLAFRRGGKVYWRNGRALADGDTVSLFSTGTPIVTITVQDEGSVVGARSTLNFVGGNVTAVDNPVDDRVDITVTGFGASTEQLTSFIPITTGKDTDSSGYVLLGHLVFDPSAYRITGTTRVIYVEGTAYVSTPGLSGDVELYDLDDATTVVVSWSGTDPATANNVISPSVGTHRYRVRARVTGSADPSQRFFIDWFGFRIINIFP